MGHRDFEVPEIIEGEATGPTFTLQGTKFVCLATAPASAFIHGQRGTTGNKMDTTAVYSFIRDCIVPKERDVFTNMVEGDDIVVPVDTLANIFEFLSEEYSQRPFQPSSGSSGGA
jgi:hypothetical protein